MLSNLQSLEKIWRAHKVDNNKGNILIVLVVLVVIAALAIGGFYFYMSQKKTPVPESTNTPLYEQKGPEESGTNLEGDLNSIDVQGLEADFDALDKDLKSL